MYICTYIYLYKCKYAVYFCKLFARASPKQNDKFEKYAAQSLNVHKKWLIVSSCYLCFYVFITCNDHMHHVITKKKAKKKQL